MFCALKWARRSATIGFPRPFHQMLEQWDGQLVDLPYRNDICSLHSNILHRLCTHFGCGPPRCVSKRPVLGRKGYFIRREDHLGFFYLVDATNHDRSFVCENFLPSDCCNKKVKPPINIDGGKTSVALFGSRHKMLLPLLLEL